MRFVIIIQKLFGYLNVTLELKDSKLILVGENGSGKSTIANIVNCLLSKDLDKLSNYDFQAIEIYKNNEEKCIVGRSRIAFDRKSYELYRERYINYTSGRSTRMHPSREADKIIEYLMASLKRAPLLFEVNEQTVEYKEIKKWKEEFAASDEAWEIVEKYFLRLEILTGEYVLDEIISEVGKVIFMPTYRRIEQDLREAGLRTVDERQEKEFKKILGSLFAFGMDDIEEFIKDKSGKIRYEINTSMEKIAGEYLNDILTNRYKESFSEIENIEFYEIDELLSRIDQKIMDSGRRKIIGHHFNILKYNKEPTEQQYMIAHYIKKLIEINKDRKKREAPIKKLTEIVNQYLYNKKMEYLEAEFRVKITVNDSTNEIAFNNLSSGEKQLIALFTLMYLNDDKIFLIIDEPELSLSVEWQERFLIDIVNCENCSGLLSTTHSPFVFQNDLYKYTRSISGVTDVS